MEWTVLSPALLLLRNGVGYGKRLYHFPGDEFGEIAAGGKNHLQMAVGINDQRAKIVIIGSGVQLILHARLTRQFCNHLGRTG